MKTLYAQHMSTHHHIHLKRKDWNFQTPKKQKELSMTASRSWYCKDDVFVYFYMDPSWFIFFTSDLRIIINTSFYVYKNIKVMSRPGMTVSAWTSLKPRWRVSIGKQCGIWLLVISLEEESQTRGPIEPNCLTCIYFLLGCAQADHLCAAWIHIAVLFQFLSCFFGSASLVPWNGFIVNGCFNNFNYRRYKKVSIILPCLKFFFFKWMTL
jgi:hypothetical protein